MTEHYAEKMVGWEEWQKEYRFGVVLLYPPNPIASVVNRLRAEHDPRSQSFCDAHVSLTVAAPSPPTEEQWHAIGASVATCPAVPVTYGPIKTYGDHPGVTLQIEPQADLDALRILVENCHPFASAPKRRWPFSAHLTIAEFISLERTAELAVEMSKLNLRGEFLCSYLSYAVPDESFRFTERRRLPLSDRAPAS